MRKLEAALSHRVDLGVSEAELNNRRRLERRQGDRRQRNVPVEHDRRQSDRRQGDRRQVNRRQQEKRAREAELIDLMESGGFNEAGPNSRSRAQHR